MLSANPLVPANTPRKVVKKQPQRKRVAVDQYMSHTLLNEIPTHIPVRGEKVPPLAVLPAMVRETDGRHYYCDLCQISCLSAINLCQHQAGRVHRRNVLLSAINNNSDYLKQDKLGVKIHVINATVAKNLDIEASVDVQSKRTSYKIVFLLENASTTAVKLRHCDVLKAHGFKCGKIANDGKIEPGGELNVELTARSRFAGNLSTIIVFMLQSDTTGEQRQSDIASSDASKSSNGSASPGSEPSSGTGFATSNPAAHVMRKVKVHFEDSQLTSLRPTAPYKRPPRVSGKRATTQVEGLPLPREKNAYELEEEVKLMTYNVPANVRSAINHSLDSTSPSGVGKTLSAEAKRIRELVAAELNEGNHQDMFKLLLQLEEIQMEVDIRKYDLASVQLGQYNANRRLLTLEVPGLMENRPSVLKGDHLFVSRSSESTRDKSCEYKGYVHEVHASQVCLGFGEKLMDVWVANMKFYCRFIFSRLPLRLQHRAVELAFENSLGDFLFPTRATACRRDKPIVPLDQLRDIRLYDRKIAENAEQLLAIKHIIAGTSRPAPFLVFGPPGTGKTVTVVETMKQVLLWIDGAHILACTPSNAAADLLAERLLEHLPSSSQLLRLCAYSRDWLTVPDSIRKHCNYNDGRFRFPPRADLMKYKVIVSTLVTAGRLVSANFPSTHFSHIFIDESGQATEPETLIAIAGIFESELEQHDGGQVVLAGDPQQLGPVLRSPLALQGGLGMSLLERYMKHTDVYKRQTDATSDGSEPGSYDDRLVVKLIRNYRSHPSILHIPNRLFYDGELQPFADEAARSMLCDWSELPKRGFPLFFHGVVGKDEREERSPSFFNLDEISVVTKYVADLLGSRRPKILQKQIGIISPYRKQVQKLRRALAGKQWKDVTVGSVEEFQGQERLVIIISTVRSSDAHVPLDYEFNLGFLRNPKRFNVAVTRAKALLIVVGNPFLLAKDTHWCSLLHYCMDHGAYTGCEFSKNELSDDGSADELLERLDQLQLNEETLSIDVTHVGEITEQLDPEWPVKE